MNTWKLFIFGKLLAMGSTVSYLGSSVGGKRKYSECDTGDDGGCQTDEDAVVDVVKRWFIKFELKNVFAEESLNSSKWRGILQLRISFKRSLSARPGWFLLCSQSTLILCRKRLKNTCDYIYQTLFLDGEGSDVTIHALGECLGIFVLANIRHQFGECGNGLSIVMPKKLQNTQSLLSTSTFRGTSQKTKVTVVIQWDANEWPGILKLLNLNYHMIYDNE